MGISVWQILIIVLVIGLLFGAKNLPQLGDGLGKAIRNFKKGVSDIEDDVEDITPKRISEKVNPVETQQQQQQQTQQQDSDQGKNA